MDRREEIYETALELFTERGFDNTPLSLIAKTLGLSKGGLFHYFESKEHLLFLLHEYTLKRDMIPLIERTEAISDPEERLSYFLQSYTRLLAENAYARVLIHEVRRLAPEHYRTITAVWRRAFDVVRKTLEELQASGKIKGTDRTFATFALIGMCSWLFYWFDYSRKDSAKKVSETFMEIFFRGIFI
ncbi:MAG: TetR/AcrR family transcriptional regulator [Thermodesulfobacteriota bacterium]